MRTWKIITIAILVIAAVALTSTTALAMLGRPGYYTSYSTSTGTPGTTGAYVTPGGGTTPYAGNYGGYYGGYGGMMGGGWGCGMMGRFSYGAPIYANPTSVSQLNITAAVSIAQNYVATTGNSNLAVSQVEEYTQNFYVMVKEKDTGIGAFELLINKYTGAVTPEMGSNMMWNTKYGMMSSGMMGWLDGATTSPATVAVEQAKADAQQYLNAYLPGTTAGDAQAFYGYYHIEVLSSSSIYGMLSVNSYTGQVWYHNWHGTFIQEVELS